MTESRKRPGSPVEDPTAAKKRAVASASGSPRGANTTDSSDPTEPGEDSNLETFRKEAIFRRMRHYAREHQRDRRRILELEAVQEQYQAGVHAIESCWNQLVSEIRALVALDDIPKSSTRTSLVKLPKVASEITAYEAAVQKRREATQTLVSAFVAKVGTDPSSEVHSLHAARREAESEAEQLRAECQLLQSQLEDSNEQLDKLRSDLEAAEMRADRIKLETSRAHVAASGQPNGSVQEEDRTVNPEVSAAPTIEINGKDHLHDGTMAEDKRPDSTEKVVASHDEIATILQKVGIFCAAVSKAVSSESKEQEPSLPSNTELDLIDLATMESVFKQIETAISEKGKRDDQLKKDKEGLEAARAELESKLYSLQTTCQTDYERDIEKLLAAQEETYKSKVLKLTEDTARLRAERDAKDAELSEKRLVLEARSNAIEELRALTVSRLDRILALQSEVKRLKGRLAAEACDEDLYQFLSSTENGDSLTYVTSLKTKLQETEDRVKVLQESLNACAPESSQSAVRSEVELRERYEITRRQLDRYQSRFGPDADASTHTLAQQLELKEKALAQAELLRKQESEALDASFVEIERLSSSWEALDRQVKSKVLDLVNVERNLAQLAAEKAKSDNKYFATRSNMDITNHKIAALENSIQRQLQLITSLKKYEEESKQLISGYETRMRDLTQKEKDMDAKIARQTESLEALSQRQKMDAQELKMVKSERDAAYDKRAEADKSANNLKESHAHLKRQLAQAQKTASTLASSSDIQQQLDWSMKVVKCSTCMENFRDQTLIKCGHTFCKHCIDTRISTRQRKCPACNLPFAQSEVISIFLQ